MWLEEIGMRQDSRLAGLSLYLKAADGIYEKGFTTNFFLASDLDTHSILPICVERRLDEDATRSVAALFNRCYSKGGQNVFLAACDWAGPLKVSPDDGIRMVFAFVDMKGHWGITRFCLTNYEISFGDSRQQAIPSTEIDNMIEWINPSEGDKVKWEQAKMKVSQLHVPEQDGNGSPDVLTVSALEHVVNQHADWSVHPSIDYYQSRLVGLLSGATEVQIISTTFKLVRADCYCLSLIPCLLFSGRTTRSSRPFGTSNPMTRCTRLRRRLRWSV